MTRIMLTAMVLMIFAATPCTLTAEITGSLTELEACARLMSEHAALMQTWSGRAEITDETNKGDDTTQRTTAVEFLYKADGHQVRYSSTQVAVKNGVEKLRSFERGLKSRTEFCSYLPKILTDPRSMSVADHLERQPADQFLPHILSTQFDPTVFTRVSGRGNVEELRYFHKNAQRFKGAGTVTVSGNLVTLKVGADGKGPHVNHTFDKSKAGMPTHFELGSEPKQITDVKYDLVDEILMPSVVTIKLDSSRRGITNLTIRFLNSKVNAEVDDAEFEVDKLPKVPRS